MKNDDDEDEDMKKRMSFKKNLGFKKILFLIYFIYY